MPRKTADAAVAAAEEATPRSRPFGFAHFTVFGRLAADAELRFSGNGNPVTRAALAVNDRAGQVHYLDVIVFGEGAKVLAQYATKGRGLVVTGRISTRTWEAQDGGRRKSVDLIADEFHFADRAPAATAE
jgi:single-strand DNA-binding protein